MKNFFKPEDFEFNPELNERYQAAKIANEKLNALIESGPVVYWSEKEQLIYRENIRDATHKARLAFIEEIVKEPCKHEPFYEEYGGGLRSPAKCKHCGVELQATWSEVKK